MVNARIFTLLFSVLIIALPTAWGASAPDPAAAATDAEIAEMIEGAEMARKEAERARAEAQRIARRAEATARAQREVMRTRVERSREEVEEIARQRASQQKEMEKAREELSRAHRELREAQREVARAHRELSGPTVISEATMVFANPGDLPVMAIVMGKEMAEGIELVAVSPGGPAEKAGLRAGDIMVKIGGENLAERKSDAKAAVFELMETVQAGDEIEVVVDRGNEVRAYGVVAEVREPASWQSMIRMPETTHIQRITGDGGERKFIIERALVPEIDEDALAERLEIIEERMAEHGELLHSELSEIAPHWKGEYEFVIEDFSDIGDQAFEGANIWFGIPQAQGLELATINEELGEYFETDQGVLVLQAREENAYRLQPGDVILEVNGNTVSSPADFMRTLRSLEPGREIEIAIKRKGRSESLNVVMPENRFGLR